MNITIVSSRSALHSTLLNDPLCSVQSYDQLSATYRVNPRRLPESNPLQRSNPVPSTLTHLTVHFAAQVPGYPYASNTDTHHHIVIDKQPRQPYQDLVAHAYKTRAYLAETNMTHVERR